MRHRIIGPIRIGPIIIMTIMVIMTEAITVATEAITVAMEATRGMMGPITVTKIT